MFDMEKLLNEILNENLKKLVLGNKRRKSAPVRKVVVRPVVIKGALLFQFEYHEDNKVTHENLPVQEAKERTYRFLLRSRQIPGSKGLLPVRMDQIIIPQKKISTRKREWPSLPMTERKITSSRKASPATFSFASV